MNTNTDFRVALDFWDHPKTQKLIRRLGLAGPVALQRLWGWTANHHPDGRLGADIEDIEIAAKWPAERPGEFVAALLDVHFLDLQGDDGSYEVHNWRKRNPWAAGIETRANKARLSRLAQLRPEYYRALLAVGIDGVDKPTYDALIAGTVSINDVIVLATAKERPGERQENTGDTPGERPASAKQPPGERPAPLPLPLASSESTPTPLPPPPSLPLGDTGSEGKEPPKDQGQKPVVKAKTRAKKQTGDPPGFADFWAVCTNKIARADALKAYRDLNPDAVLQTRMVNAKVAQNAFRAREIAKGNKPPAQPYPATWIRGARWEDEIESEETKKENEPVRWKERDGTIMEERDGVAVPVIEQPSGTWVIDEEKQRQRTAGPTADKSADVLSLISKTTARMSA